MKSRFYALTVITLSTLAWSASPRQRTLVCDGEGDNLARNEKLSVSAANEKSVKVELINIRPDGSGFEKIVVKGPYVAGGQLPLTNTSTDGPKTFYFEGPTVESSRAVVSREGSSLGDALFILNMSNVGLSLGCR